MYLIILQVIYFTYIHDYLIFHEIYRIISIVCIYICNNMYVVLLIFNDVTLIYVNDSYHKLTNTILTYITMYLFRYGLQYGMSSQKLYNFIL